MRLGLSLALTVLATAPALAQPATRPPANQPPASQPPASQPPAIKPPADPPADALSAFEKELDALFTQGGLTADQAAARAPAASPSVRKSAAQIDAAIAQAEAAELVRVPRVGATATYTRLSSIDPLPFGPPDPITGEQPKIEFPTNSFGAQAQVGIALSDYVLRYPKIIEAAKLGLEAARVSKRADEIGAGQDARLAYYEWVRAKLQVLIATRQLTQVRATLGQVRALAEAQRLSNADRMRVESQEAQAEQVLDQLRFLTELREEQLRLLIGAAPGEPLVVGEDIRVELGAPSVEALDQLLAKAKQQRLEFRALDIGIQAKDKQREAEKANQLPKLSAFATTDYAKPNQRVFFQPDQFKFTWSAGLQLSWTLNDMLLSRTTERRIDAERRELAADRENLERGTRLAVLAAQQAVALAQRAFATSQKGLAAAEESYRVRQALLAAQRGTAVELVDAETDLTRARITALNARVDLRVALTQLAHALGNDIK
ncbi:MAG TPA: TolC family protein [Kofleriaceae bacterium]|nr:TolC family protein [Kofleriaceae bacterium]